MYKQTEESDAKPQRSLKTCLYIVVRNK